MIEPCATTTGAAGRKICGIFHLLTCGHIIAIDNEDRRCGRNCQHAATLSASTLEHSEELISHMQYNDKLHCETCYGIPFDRYRLITSQEEPFGLRRSLAITRSMLQTNFGLDHDLVNAMLCSPFFNSTLKGFDWNNTHALRCGHEVWSITLRPCGANCTDAPGCRGASYPQKERRADAILCQECVARAELVYQRYTKLEEERASRGGDGGVSAGPRATPEPREAGW
ncbi:hypothetical protein CC86DRAFT_288865 [Ophiobolus disseminans]|uniref:Uncharacterized protein n=1 Tax=Ophiobolus disseminans TaxID=1469910 RepID=A0A6A7A3S6_9PLEO|nr:hypothetical protein CC86DRAFT_288865 [Ophiobolus disseminans]